MAIKKVGEAQVDLKVQTDQGSLLRATNQIKQAGEQASRLKPASVIDPNQITIVRGTTQNFSSLAEAQKRAGVAQEAMNRSVRATTESVRVLAEAGKKVRLPYGTSGAPTQEDMGTKKDFLEGPPSTGSAGLDKFLKNFAAVNMEVQDVNRSLELQSATFGKVKQSVNETTTSLNALAETGKKIKTRLPAGTSGAPSVQVTAPTGPADNQSAQRTAQAIANADKMTNSLASVSNVAGKVAVSVGGLYAALVAWPVASIGLATVAILANVAAHRKAAKDFKDIQTSLIRTNTGPLSNKGAALLPIAARATADQGPALANYLTASLVTLPTRLGGALTNVGSKISGLFIGMGKSVQDGGAALLIGSQNWMRANSVFKQVAGIAGSFASPLLQLVGGIPKVFTGLLSGVSGGLSKLGASWKTNAAKELVTATEAATLLGGKAGFWSSYFGQGANLKPEVRQQAYSEAASYSQRQLGIASSKGELTRIEKAIDKQTEIVRQGQSAANSGGVGTPSGKGGFRPSGGQQGAQATSGGGIGIGTAGIGLTALGGAITAPILAATKSFAAYGDSIEKASQKTGIQAEALAGLMHAATLANVSQEQLTTGIRYMQKNIVDAATGSEQAERKLRVLGISVKDLQGKTADQQLAIFADKFADISDPAIKAAAAMGIFGISGTQLLPFLNGGSEALARYKKDAELLGLTMSGEAASAAARYGDQMSRLQGSLLGISNAIGTVVAPIISDLLNYIIAGVVTVRNFISENKGLVVTVLEVGVAIGTAGAALLGILGTFTAVGVAISALPLAATGAAIATLVGGFLLLADTISGVLGFGSVGFADFLSQIQIGGASIGQWLNIGWTQALIGFEIMKEQVTKGFNYMLAGVKTVARFMVDIFGNIGNAIAQGFYSAIKGVVDGIAWLGNKVLKAGYELHLIDDQELVAASAAIRDLQGGANAWADKKKKQANDVYTDPEQTDFFAQAAEKNKKASEEAQRQIKMLTDLQTEIFNNPATASKSGFDFSKIKDGLAALTAGFQKTLADVKAGEEGGKRVAGDQNITYDSISKSSEKVFGSFSGRALAGAGVSKVDSLQKESNNLLKQIVENTGKSNKAVFD